MDDQLQADICARIKQARIEAGFTLQDAADALDVTMRAYQNYERDRVPFRRLAEICSIFAVPLDWLLRGDDARLGDGDVQTALIRATADGVTKILGKLDRIEEHLGLDEAESA